MSGVVSRRIAVLGRRWPSQVWFEVETEWLERDQPDGSLLCVMLEEGTGMSANHFPLASHEIEIRVRYQETDGQGRLHHANYINYFEVGRVEMLRAAGHNYRELERSGIYLVVVEVECQYRAAAWYDDLLTVRTSVEWAKGTRIRHSSDVKRGEEILATGATIVASVSPEGRVLRLPAWLRYEPGGE
ncbi:MAG: acyl-CoA thioesterase [Planctomycetota bacterium]